MVAAEPSAGHKAHRPPRPTLAVAPMIDVTDRHFRMMMRCISPLPVLYSEMTWDRAILYNSSGEPEQQLNRTSTPRSVDSLLGYTKEEHPIVLQLGGADPDSLARAARIGAIHGYDEINLNCGCPAQTKGRSKNTFGARLMKEPDRVAACCAAMKTAVAAAAERGELGRDATPPEITVKCRLGVDEVDSWEELLYFVRAVSGAGVRHFVVHARKAILGLNTIQNRSVPPLRHDWVFALADEFPDLTFTVNGGISSIEEAMELLTRGGVHGVMIGRRANADPYLFARCGVLFSGEAGPSRREVLERYFQYAPVAQAANYSGWTSDEQNSREIITPLTGLFHNTPFGPRWRQKLTAVMKDRALLKRPVVETLRACLADCLIPDDLLDDRPSLQLRKNVRNVYSQEPRQGGQQPAANGEAVAQADGEEGCCGTSRRRAEQEGTWGDACTSSAGAGAATERAPAADDDATPRRRREGKGEAELEAVLLAESRAAAYRAGAIGLACAVALLAIGGLATAARRSRVVG